MSGKVDLPTTKANLPVLVGSASRGQLRIIVQNIGPLRVWLGTREDLAPPNFGTLLARHEQFTHDGADALYAQLDPALATVTPAAVALLRFQQYFTDPPGAAAISGPDVRWPEAGPTW